MCLGTLFPATCISHLFSQEAEMCKMQNHPETCFLLSMGRI